MDVVFIKEPGEIELLDVPEPAVKDGEALLKIKYCGICGSDIATYTGNQPFASYPRIPGHEFSAEIVDIEDNDLGLKAGMIVTANPYFNCGHCYPCSKGKVNCCESNETMGVQRDGSFAEYITMPIERIVNGRGLSAQTLALIEPFSIGYHAINRGNIKNKDNVLVIGAGPIGIFAMLSAKLAGAKVTIVDMLKERLDLAKSMGADQIVNVSQKTLAKEVEKLTNGNGMDACVEAVGHANTFLQCIENAAFGGKIILIGNGKTETKFNHSILLKKELDVYGSRNSLYDFKPLIDKVKTNNLDIEKIITHIYAKEDVLQAFKELNNNDGSMAKVLIKFN
ncbi:zinc-binding alcohol dehydrogenase family protein [Halanaerobium salsuginis]|jgi:2-desacetyl-2-hydroxyethyl bacteriochlorophyllide A dehydrogenase|uniref:2-desacetyl-2-hydroxyethyl bacteriochlorophyllide A dehydrogenase n=1 Tax=Halanaerobium salsuginis TaxID=29563 RepID=A0A1I4JKR3_9FIRM|nr:zinc-binding alcohol dehydrogenase family protein [Halanaerobium salsuginis]SFL67140.1 2-desacetyl-2-hydroxyethyl bacteriochlorophyllide A dehydrogenase [Halanaerobium salsuginis]